MGRAVVAVTSSSALRLLDLLDAVGSAAHVHADTWVKTTRKAPVAREGQVDELLPHDRRAEELRLKSQQHPVRDVMDLLRLYIRQHSSEDDCTELFEDDVGVVDLGRTSGSVGLLACYGGRHLHAIDDQDGDLLIGRPLELFLADHVDEDALVIDVTVREERSDHDAWGAGLDLV